VQQAARRRLIDHHDVDKLRHVMQANGFLPSDRVVVRKVDDEKYVVLEENRRICAAKEVTGCHDDGEPVPEGIIATFKKTSSLVYKGRDAGLGAAWIFQGLRHVSGISGRPAFNKTRLHVDRMQEDELNLTDVGKIFGISAHGAGQWVRGYLFFSKREERLTSWGRWIRKCIHSSKRVSGEVVYS